MAKLRLDLQLTGFQQASSKLKQFGDKMKSVGSSLSAISLPLAIAGGAAIKMGADFDKNITKIKALVGASEKDLQDFSNASKRMAKETGLSSKQTSDAMFFIASAGLEGAEAIAVLEAASKASAAGLGDVAQVADLATSALNAYGSETLSAEAATDVLTAAVREGKLNSEDLAASMGQVLPVASNMGVSFNEVGAAMAAMSRTGTNAAQGVTQLNSILSGLLKPTKQAEEALAEMGLSSAGLKQQIKDEGLLSVLETLKTEFDKNSDAAAQVFPNIRALRGVLDLTGASADTTKEIFNELNKAQGATKKAFDDTAKSASFRLTKSLNGVKESFASVGTVLLEKLLPTIEKIASGIETLFNKFTNLDDTTQKIIIAFGLFVTAIGPLLLAVGSLTSIIGIMGSGFATLKIATIALKGGFVKLTVAMMANPFIAIATAVVALTGYLVTMGNKMAPLISKWQTFKNILKSGGSYSKFATLQLIDQNAALKKQKEETEKNNKELAKLGETNVKIITPIANTNTALETTASRLKAISVNAISVKEGFAEVGEGVQIVGTVLLESIEPVVKKTTQLSNILQMVGQEIPSMFTAAFESMMHGESFIKSLGKMLLGLIKKLVAAAAAALVLSTLLGGTGLGKILKISSSFKEQFGKMTGFAKGGIVSGPTLGLVGEYPGARSNPEVIAPLDKLKSMIGDRGGSSNVQVSGQFALKGQDLVVALQRADRNRNRIK
jgi:TP901 family phage tail tape measure protein